MSSARAIVSEAMKYRRSFTRILVVLGPAGLVLAYALVGVLGGSRTTWSLFLAVIYNWWPVLWIPMGAALLAALAASTETQSGAWRTLRARPLRPSTLYGAKLAVLALHTLASSLLLMVLVFIVGSTLIDGPVPWSNVMLGALLPWLAALPLLAFQLWIATGIGVGGSIVLGVVGFVAGGVAAESGWWAYVPWAWPVRAAMPMAGIHANGIPLSPGDPLWNPIVALTAIALSLGVMIAVVAASSLWFSRSEVR